ncbi:MAG: DNA polymerase III subunit gamma/tau [bacterium]
MNNALYRRYRPKTLEELLGQDMVSEVLLNAAKQDKIGHAYLFYGSRGTGKTTAARLIAKIVNCEKRISDTTFQKKGEPCNECRPCKEIDAGHALDVIEIDAASNRGIDEMRNLKEGIRLSPISYKYKVFIIDEAHQLTKEASNALLKTLEEPPAHAIFILATTEYDKLLPTITSRTQRFNFRRPTFKTILNKLEKIADEEKLKINPKTLQLIARSADGSFRDAESLLEQVVSLGAGENVTDVEQILGKIGLERTATLAEYLIVGDMRKTLSYLEDVYESGSNIVQLAKDLIHHLRRTLALKYEPSLSVIFERELSEEEIKTLSRHATLITDEKRIIILLKSLIRAYGEMKYSPFAFIPLQVAIIENLIDSNKK